jgi:hypothetical protein
MVVMLRVVMMVAMTVVIAHLDNRDGTISLPAAPNALGLARQEIKSHKGDHRVADAFELIRPGIDLESGGAKRDQEHADEDDRSQRLRRR